MLLRRMKKRSSLLASRVLARLWLDSRVIRSFSMARAAKRRLYRHRTCLVAEKIFVSRKRDWRIRRLQRGMARTLASRASTPRGLLVVPKFALGTF